jgi:raffinose/stachyose/melibiose transport system substrate-binding protein
VQYQRAGLLADMSAYAKQYNWAGKIFPWALDSGRFKGGLWDIPNQYETIVIYYNKTLFAKYGLQPAATWAQFEALCTTLASKGVIPISFGTIGWTPAVEWMVGTFFSHDAGPAVNYQALTGTTSWTNPLLVDSMAKYNEIWQRGWLTQKKAFGLSLDQSWALMSTQKAAMKMDGTWDFQGVGGYAKNWQWDWAPFPIMRPGVPQNYDLSIGGTMSINAKSASKDAAATFINWLYSDPKRAAAIAAAIPGDWHLPVAIPAADFPASYDPRFLRAQQAILAASTSGHFAYPTWVFYGPKTEQLIIDDVYRMFAGKITPAQMMAEVQKAYTAEKKAGAWPPVPAPSTH